MSDIKGLGHNLKAIPLWDKGVVSCLLQQRSNNSGGGRMNGGRRVAFLIARMVGYSLLELIGRILF